MKKIIVTRSVVFLLTIAALYGIFGYIPLISFIVALLLSLLFFYIDVRILRNKDIAAITKVRTNVVIDDESYQIIVENIEKTGLKLKTASVKRTYLLFGDYVYTLKFVKQ